MGFGKFNRKMIKHSSAEYRQNRKRKLAPAQKTQVKKIIQNQAEKKFRAINIPEVAGLSDTPVILKLNQTDGVTVPPKGLGDNDRNGDAIRWHSLKMKLFVHNIDSSTEVHYIRFIIFQWHQNDATVPTVGDVLLSGNNGVGYDSQYSQDYAPVRTILYDRTFACGIASDNQVQQLTTFVKIKRPNVRFATGTDPETGTNQLYYVVLGSGTSATECPVLFNTILLKYTDI